MQNQSSTISRRFILTCTICGMPFETYPSVADRRAVKYCSQQCYHQARRNASPEDRFWAQTVENATCCLWIGSLQPNGYGMFSVGGKSYGAHRWIFERAHGPLPRNILVCHTCESLYPPGDITSRRCVKIAHLSAGTTQENMQYASKLGRMAKGERNGAIRYPERLKRGIDSPMTHFTPQDIEAIRSRYAARELSQHQLAVVYGASQSTIWRIINYKVWVPQVNVPT